MILFYFKYIVALSLFAPFVYLIGTKQVILENYPDDALNYSRASLQHAQVSSYPTQISPTNYVLNWEVMIDPGYYTYSQLCEKDVFAATQIIIDKEKTSPFLLNYISLPATEIGNPDHYFDRSGTIKNAFCNTYKNSILFKSEIQLPQPLASAQTVAGKFVFTTCNKKSCDPTTTEYFELTIGP
ncbi:MAG TPA: hypothetical protein PKD56_09175 [Chitinophagales bacterium]|jgi:hypothetical protein|nr:hypothetical protein [Chitinophagales bacterium]